MITPPDLQVFFSEYGGYWNIDWAEWGSRVAGWQAQRRQYLAPAPDRSHRRRRTKRNTTSSEGGAS
jgi:hypothetical protein